MLNDVWIKIVTIANKKIQSSKSLKIEKVLSFEYFMNYNEKFNFNVITISQY